jgi:uncharacterized membrane protein
VVKGQFVEMKRTFKGDNVMLWTIFVILLVLWLAGLMTGYTLGGILHVLLVIAVIVVLVQVLKGRKIN